MGPKPLLWSTEPLSKVLPRPVYQRQQLSSRCNSQKTRERKIKFDLFFAGLSSRVYSTDTPTQVGPSLQCGNRAVHPHAAGSGPARRGKRPAHTRQLLHHQFADHRHQLRDEIFVSQSAAPATSSCSRSRAITDGATLRIGLLRHVGFQHTGMIEQATFIYSQVRTSPGCSARSLSSVSFARQRPEDS